MTPSSETNSVTTILPMVPPSERDGYGLRRRGSRKLIAMSFHPRRRLTKQMGNPRETALPELLSDPDREKSQRVMSAMMGMKKIKIDDLARAGQTGPTPRPLLRLDPFDRRVRGA